MQQCVGEPGTVRLDFGKQFRTARVPYCKTYLRAQLRQSTDDNPQVRKPLQSLYDVAVSMPVCFLATTDSLSWSKAQTT
jgi:hypothetical protein